MHLLVIILNKEEFLDDILSSLLEAGIMSATIIESSRMSEILSHDLPIFAGLRQIMKGGRAYNRVIVAPVEDIEAIDELLKILKQINIDFQKPGTGFLFTIPVENFSGNLEDLEIEF